MEGNIAALREQIKRLVFKHDSAQIAEWGGLKGPAARAEFSRVSIGPVEGGNRKSMARGLVRVSPLQP